MKRLFDFIELERLDNRLDLFHWRFLSRIVWGTRAEWSGTYHLPGKNATWIKQNGDPRRHFGVFEAGLSMKAIGGPKNRVGTAKSQGKAGNWRAGRDLIGSAGA
ncbi:MAG: hypothetical protein ACLPSF_06925 [Methylocella sp.]